VSEKLPEITTYFLITSDAYFDPATVAQRLPIAATRTETKGELRPAPRPPVKESSWRIECEDRRIQSIDEGVCEILDIVWPHRAEILRVLSDLSLSSFFVSYVRVYDLGVIYELRAETMARMVELRAEWNMDLYDFSE
jgi:Domain of unknown function (DUF4279)